MAKLKLKSLIIKKIARLPTQLIKKVNQVRRLPNFNKYYGLFGLMVLAGTSLFWSLLGASLHRTNSDQLITAYLFNNQSTFDGAVFPAAHSFLFKWPLFSLFNVFGVSGFSLGLITVFCVLTTVLGLAYIVKKIEPRPLYFGTVYLALASILLLIPAQPYGGALLPLNMAMVATRNLEYLLYIIGLFWLVRSMKLKNFNNRYFWLGAALLTILAASDKLFLYLSLGGGATAGLFYIIHKNPVRQLIKRWLMAGIIALLGSSLILWLIDHFGISHISHLASSGPFSLISSFKDLFLGVIFAVMGFLTNFGANPAFEATIIKDLPHKFFAGLTDIAGPAYIINALLLAFGIYTVICLMRQNLKKTAKRGRLDLTSQLSLMLVMSAMAALALFVVTKHYYAVDARFLSISLFAVTIAAVSHLRSQKFKPNFLLIVGGIISLGIILGIVAATSQYNTAKAALASINKRNNLVAQALDQHKVKALVGDYWRVMPIKFASNSDYKPQPLVSCLQPRQDLTSKDWQLDLKNTPFAYLLASDRGLTDFPACNLDEIIYKYGRPNSSVLIEGRVDKPLEQLLFYDTGIRPTQVDVAGQTPATIKPVALDMLPNVTCKNSTIMNIVAHQDDDLLFLSPDLIHSLKSEDCVRTIYLTAGDAGRDKYYWLPREQGSEAAYDRMLDSHGSWVKRIVQLDEKQFIRVDNPQRNSKVSIIFMRLSDGNPNGSGFKVSSYESLEKLQNGRIDKIHTVDGQANYSYEQLNETLTKLMQTYKPSEIRTQSIHNGSYILDHSDHKAVGHLVRRAAQKYNDQVPVKYYYGYPIYELSDNVFGDDLNIKEAAFFAYGQFDPSVCPNLEKCQRTSTYGSYLKRQYRSDN